MTSLDSPTPSAPASRKNGSPEDFILNIPDLINGIFELLGGVAVFGHTMAVLRDKRVRGIDWRSSVVMVTWGFWNLYYYPHLDQWLSFLGGIAIVAGNVVWLTGILYYLRKERLENATNDTTVLR